jgi:2',3'-cyclic-nucleotide 2'-phosphodiesterase (5'-nucleotidase family)
MSSARIGRTLGLLAVLSVLSAPVRGASPEGAEGTVHLRIIHTQEHHGQALPIPASSPSMEWGGLAARATLFANLRGEASAKGWGLLTLDSGDILVGTPLSTAFRGEADLAVLNGLGYDAMTVGNHEFDFESREQRLAILLGLAKFPCLAANIRGWEDFGASSGDRELRIFERGGLRIGVVGLTHPWTRDISSPSAGVTFDDPVATAKRVIAEHAGQVDLWIALSHEETWQDAALLAAVPELAVVVGGHTLGFRGMVTRSTFPGPINDHNVPDLLPPQPTDLAKPDGVYVRVGEGPFHGRLGTFVGVLDLEVDRSTAKVLRATSRNVPVHPATPLNIRSTRLEGFHFGSTLAERARFRLVKGTARKVQLLPPLPPGCDEPEITSGSGAIELAWPEPCWAPGTPLTLAAEIEGEPAAAADLPLRVSDAWGKEWLGCATLEKAVPSPVPPDPWVEATLAPFLASLDEKLRVVVGRTEVDLDGRREVVRRRETNLGNLLADIFRQTQKTEIGIENSGGIRSSIPRGNIRLADLLPVLPFGNTVVRFRIRGKDLVEGLEVTLSQIEQGTGRYPQVSGLCFSFDPQAPVGKRLLGVRVGEAPIDPERIYSVATNNFFASGGDGLAVIRDRKLEYRDSQFVDVDVVATWLSQVGAVAPTVEGRATEKGILTVCDRIATGEELKAEPVQAAAPEPVSASPSAPGRDPLPSPPGAPTRP